MFLDYSHLAYLKENSEDKPCKKALLIIDYINDIVHPDGAVAHFGTPLHVVSQHATENTKAVLGYARKQKTKIIFIRVCFRPNYPELDDTKAPFYKAHIENGWLQKNTWGTEFYEGLQPQAGELVIEKHRVNPFTNPKLLKELRGVNEIVIAGVATNLSVEETVRSAAALNFSVVVLEDCCASNNQDMHDFSIQQIMPKFAMVTSSKEYVNASKQ